MAKVKLAEKRPSAREVDKMTTDVYNMFKTCEHSFTRNVSIRSKTHCLSGEENNV